MAVQEPENSEVPSVPKVISVVVDILDIEDAPKTTFRYTVNETVRTVMQNLTLLPHTLHLTCYDLFLNDNYTLPLLDSDVLGSLLSNEEDETLHLILKNRKYTLKDVQEHIMKTRDNYGMLESEKSDPLGYGFKAIGSGSSKFLELKLDESKVEPLVEEEKAKEIPIELKNKLIACKNELLSSKNFKGDISDLVSPSKPSRLAPALKNLSLSSWNPVSSCNRLSNGHLAYIQLQTLEGENFHITATVNGFYINNSSNSRFDPSMKTKNFSSKPLAQSKSKVFHALHSLVVLLVSPKFVTVQEQNKEKLLSSSPLAFIPSTNSLLAAPWMISSEAFNDNREQEPDFGKIQSSNLTDGVDGVEKFRDWNEDYQSLVELSKETLQDRTVRESLLNKFGFDFTAEATKTAISIINGDIPAFDSSEQDYKKKFFIRNNIFYSFILDADGLQNTDLQAGDKEESSRYSTKKDLFTIRRLNQLDDNKIKYALTAIIDYAGYRVVCQGLIPGILNPSISLREDDLDDEGNLIVGDEKKELERLERSSRILYGLNDELSEIKDSKLFEKSMSTMSNFFHMKKHKTWALTADGKYSNVSELITSIDAKGVKGFDERLYAVDIFKTTPLDIGFIEENFENQTIEKQYPFRQVLLRHELIDAWFRSKITEELKSKESEAAGEDQEISLDIDPTKYKFNVDAFGLASPPSSLTKQELEEIAEDEKTIRSISSFLRSEIIENFMNNVFSGKTVVALDGEHLTNQLHSEGINLRYLGFIASKVVELKQKLIASRKVKADEVAKENEKFEAEKKSKRDATAVDSSEDDNSNEVKGSEDKSAEENFEEEKQEDHFDLNDTICTYNAMLKVVIQEIIARSCKHMLRKLIDGVPVFYAPSIISYFLNLLFDPENNLDKPEFVLSEFLQADSDSEKVVKRVTNTICDSSSLIDLLIKNMYKRFRFEIDAEQLQKYVSFNRVAVLREISIKFGFQLTTKSLISKDALSFIPSDISNIVPKVSDCIFNSYTADEILTTAHQYVYNNKVSQSEEDKDSDKSETDEVSEKEHAEDKENSNSLSISLLNEARSVHEQVYGSIHPKIADLYGSFANIYTELDKTEDAIDFIKKSIIISERVYGIDSYKTILSLLSLAVYENAVGNKLASLQLYNQLIELLKLKFNYVHEHENNNIEDLKNGSIMTLHPLTIRVYSNIASIYNELYMFPDCVEVFDEGYKLSKEFNGADANITYTFLYRKCQTILQTGDIVTALRQFDALYHELYANTGAQSSIAKECRLWVERLTRFTIETSKANKNIIMQQVQQQQQQLQQQQSGASKKKNKKKKKKNSSASAEKK